MKWAFYYLYYNKTFITLCYVYNICDDISVHCSLFTVQGVWILQQNLYNIVLHATYIYDDITVDCSGSMDIALTNVVVDLFVVLRLDYSPFHNSLTLFRKTEKDYKTVCMFVPHPCEQVKQFCNYLSSISCIYIFRFVIGEKKILL